MSRAVHQFHPALGPSDATSNQLLRVQALLQGEGRPSELFAEITLPNFGHRTDSLEGYARRATAESVLLLHYSIGYSPEALGWLERAAGRRVLVYHNITPPHFFANINEHFQEAAWRGLEQLPMLVALCDAAWGVSHFNRQALVAAGALRSGVLPIIFDPARYELPSDGATERRLAALPGPRLLFVGRVSPNKKHEDLIVALHALRHGAAPGATLHLVGSDESMAPYRAFLDALVQELGLAGAVHFHGKVTQSELAAFYRGCDLLLCLSEHEGFCVPLLEAMHYGLPIVAFDAAAVAETLGGAGLLLHRKCYPELAELIALLLADQRWCAALIAGQRARLQRFLPARVGAELTALLEALP